MKYGGLIVEKVPRVRLKRAERVRRPLKDLTPEEKYVRRVLGL